jgi:nitrite reductase/ring-hydroxylating ferredoxin subunit
MDFAASWYPLLQSSELRHKPVALQRFGERFVAWRVAGGTPVIMGEHCPHMGASLAQGSVSRDGCLQCPFHGWRFDGSGRCVEVPGEERIPIKAHRTPLITAERYGHVWAWWGTEQPLFELPRFPHVDAAAAFGWPTYGRYDVTAPARLLLSNSFDGAHLRYVHSLRFRSVDQQYPPYSKEGEIQPRGVEPEAWYGGITKMDVQSFSFSDVFYMLYKKIILREEADVAAMLAASFQIERVGLRIDAWPTGLCAELFMNEKLALTFINSVAPVDTNRCIFGTTVFRARTGNVFHDAVAWGRRYFERWHSGNDGEPLVFDNVNTDAGGLYVAADRAVLGYLELYDRYCARVDPAWLLARQAGTGGRARGAANDVLPFLSVS